MKKKHELIKDDLEKLENVLDEAKKDYAYEPELFLKSKIFKMGRFIRLYHEFMTDLEVELDHETLNELANLDSGDLLISKLECLKTDWNLFLQQLDDNVSDSINSLKIGEYINQSIADSDEYFLKINENGGNSTSLKDLHKNFSNNKKSYIALVMLRHFAWLPWQDHAKDIKKKVNEFVNLNCQVVFVSFGELNGACRWYNENRISTTFDMITDHQRKIYQLFDMKKSYFKVWCIDTLVYYAEQLNFKRQLPKSYEDVEDDPHQMGGNLILQVEQAESNIKFKVAYVYRSKTPPDRPSSTDLLSFIQNIDN